MVFSVILYSHWKSLKNKNIHNKSKKIGQNLQECPRGSYSNQTGLSNITQCTPCDGGYFCNITSAQHPSGKCMEGYYCKTGSFLSNPTEEICSNFKESPFSCVGDVCPAGSYCELGSELPKVIFS